jgi:multiple sugar transport system permease protein/sorbitol/mannitol transport system permease protein
MRFFSQLVVRLAVWLVILIALVPFIFMLTTSFKPTGEALAIPPSWLFQPTLANYVQIVSGQTVSSQVFLWLVIHSAIVACASTVLTLALGLPAAYALARIRFRGRNFLSSWILSTIMFPPVVAVIPVFILAGNLQLFDTYPVLIIPYIAFNLPIVIWILRSTIFQLPGEIEEAALVDGCSRLGMIVRIVLPLIGSGIATSAILSIILCWNEFLFALSLTRSNVLTAPVGISEFTGGMFGTQWGPLTAASTIVLLPIIVMILILRRRLIAGLTMGAVK